MLKVIERGIVGLGLLVGLGLNYALAQSPVQTQPYPVTVSGRANGTITVTSTFQAIFAASPSRRAGCFVQNLDTSDMFVYFGTITNASTPTSVKLGAGVAVSCATEAGGVLQDAISITGTAGQRYMGQQQ